MDFAVGFGFGMAAGWLTAALARVILGLVGRSLLGGGGRPAGSLRRRLRD